MQLETHNLRQLEQLNQRGGRMLSIVDLIQAGTIGAEMAGHAMLALADGASLLTGARPGGAGKTTLMAALLGLMPPGVPILTVDDARVVREGLRRSNDEPACYLVHEIGAGHWFGYLWGPDVADFVSLIDGRRRIASCLHADTLEELTGILASRPLDVPAEAIDRVGLILFIHVIATGRQPLRRVASFWQSDGRAGHRQIFRWNREADTFERCETSPDPTPADRYVRFIRELVADGDVEMEAVRRKVVEFYRRAQ